MQKKTHRSTGHLSLIYALLVGLTAVAAHAAEPPQWWAGRGVLTADAANDFAVLNAGQLKHLAYMAWLELDALPGGAGFAPAFTNAGNDYAAVNLGQLKEVARPFYERMGLSNYRPLLPGVFVHNYAPANIGQAKHLFSFDPANPDFDGDGIPNLVEVNQYGTDPLAADTDGDGVTDSDELGYYKQIPFQWYDTSDGTNLLAGETSSLDGRLWRVALLSPVTIDGIAHTNLSIDLNGLIYLPHPTNSTAVTGYYHSNEDLSAWKNNQGHIAIAAYWDDLYTRPALTTPEIRMAHVASNSCTVVEFRNVGLYGYGSDKTNECATFQVILPQTPSNTVYVNYTNATVGMRGQSATLGVQNPHRRLWSNTNLFYNLTWSHSTSSSTPTNAVTPPMSLAYHIGVGTCPTNRDTDADGLWDGAEVYTWQTDPFHPDSDRDGLPDGAEIDRGTDPLNPDTDGDGMTDGWEDEHRLAPLNPADAWQDADDDGLPNLAEFRAGTNPRSHHSDGDSVSDGIEAAWWEPAAPIPWFDMSGGTTVLHNVDWDDRLIPAPLPFAVRIGGAICTNAQLDINGMVYFIDRLKPMDSRVASRYTNADLALRNPLLTDNHFAVAAHWDDLYARPASPATTITVADVTTNGTRWCVIEYRDMGFRSNVSARVSFQIAFPGTGTNTVYVRYADSAGANTGASATLGAQGPGAAINLPVSFDRPFITNGLTLAYHFGSGGSPLADDTDGDGLPDDRELALGTSPANPDSDGDGLPDKWEADNDLDPLSVFGGDGADGDPDGDGLLNRDELGHGTKAKKTDTDNDGLTDLKEAGGVIFADIPWFTLSGAADITPLFSNLDSSCQTVPLTAPAVIRGTVFTNLTLDINGLAYLNPVGYQNAAYSQSGGSDMTGSWTVNANTFTLAPFWSDLIAVTNAEPASQILSGTASDGASQYHVIEYRNLRYNYWPVSVTNMISFQIVVPLGATDRLFVRYALASGTADGREASVGLQWLGGNQKDSWCYRQAGRVQPGLALGFIVGSGTDPLHADIDGDGLTDSEEVSFGTDSRKADTDGDGIPEIWEIRYGLDPLNPADATRDNDGDGAANIVEFHLNTDPSDRDSVDATLPPGWASMTVGQPSPELGFSAVKDTGVVVFGGGNSSAQYDDHLQMCLQPIWGDFELTASVTFVVTNSGNAGLAVVEGLATRNRKWATFFKPDRTHGYSYRDSEGGEGSYSSGSTLPVGTTSVWHKLTRSGGRVSAFYSTNSFLWTEYTHKDWSSPAAQMFAGLYVRSDATNAYSIARFAHVSVLRSVAPVLSPSGQGAWSASCVIPDSVVRYTLDGSDPAGDSPVFVDGISFAPGTVVKVAAFMDDAQVSITETCMIPPEGKTRGVCAEYFYGLFTNVTDVAGLYPNRIALEQDIAFAPTGNVPVASSGRCDNFAVRYTGSIFIPETGSYVFHLSVNGQAALLIDGTNTVQTSGNASSYNQQASSAPVELTEGLHDVQVVYCRQDQYEPARLSLEWTGPGFFRRPFPADKLLCAMPDADNDGFFDMEELLVYGSDPDDSESRPSVLPSEWVVEGTLAEGIRDGAVRYMDGIFFIDSGSVVTNMSLTDCNQYAFQLVSGDFDICAKIKSVSHKGYAGLFARESSAPDAKKFETYQTNNGYHGTRFRSAAGAGELYSERNPVSGSEFWTRITRQGNTMTGFYSTNGITWTQYSSQNIAMAEDLKVGFYARSTLSRYAYNEYRQSSLQAKISDITLVLKGRPPLSLVSSEGILFTNRTFVSCITPLAGTTVYYTTNGLTPNISCPLMTTPVEISGPCVLQAMATHPDCVSNSYAGIFVSDRHLTGWIASCYAMNATGWPDFSSFGTPAGVTRVSSIDFDRTYGVAPPGRWTDQVAMRYRTTVFTPSARVYTFALENDDAAQLIIDDVVVIDDHTPHSWRKREGAINLGIGLHTVEVRYLELSGMAGLKLTWNGVLSQAMQPVSPLSCFVDDLNQNGLADTAEGWAGALLGVDGLSDSNGNGIDDLTELVIFGGDSLNAGTAPLEPQALDPSDLLPGLTVASYPLGTSGPLMAFPQGQYPTKVASYYGQLSFSSFYGLCSDWVSSRFGLVFEGYLHVPHDDLYRFELTAADAGTLDIGGRRIVSAQGGGYQAFPCSGMIALRAGYHAVEIRVASISSYRNLTLSWASQSSARGYEVIPASQFFRSITVQNALAAVIDTDGDGVPDTIDNKPKSHNYQYGDPFDPALADSDGDGVSDYEERYLALTDPYVEDIDGAAIAASVTVPGAEGIPVTGFWYPEDASIFCASRNGKIAYSVTLPMSGCYRLSLLTAEHSDQSTEVKFDLGISVDGITNGVCIIDSRYGRTNLGRIYTQFLPAGQHTVTIDWRNTKIPHSLRILSLSLECLGGVDEDNDGVPDWMTNRQNKSIDFSVPVTTFISPVCIEGTCASGMESLVLGGYFVAEETPGYHPVAKRLPGNTWYADVEIDPEAPSVLTATHGVSGVSVTNIVEWVPFNLFASREIVLRQNDALMFTFLPPFSEGQGTASALLSLDEPLYGGASLVDFGATNIYRFTRSGVYTFCAEWETAAGSNAVSRTVVRVSGGSFLRDPLLALNCNTLLTNTLPADAWVAWDSNLRIDPSPDCRSFYATLTTPATAYIAARLGEDGPVLATARVDDLGFASHTQSGYMDYFKTLDDGSEVFEGRISVKNLRPGMTVRLRVYSTGNYFENGEAAIEFRWTDFDENGELRFLMYMAPYTDHFCQFIEIFLDGVPVNF